MFCGVPFRPFVARPHERRFALRLFNVGSEKFLEADLAKQFLHSGDTEDFSLIGVEACAFHSGGNGGFIPSPLFKKPKLMN